MKRLLFLSIIFTANFVIGQHHVVYFDKDSYSLSDASTTLLDSIATELKAYQNLGEIAIIGHTDTDASNAYNQELSSLRAHAVKNYFSGKGIYNRFHLISKGEENTINENRDEPEKRQNRRVEIILNYQVNNYAFDSFEQEPQVFSIGPYEDATLTTAYGTQITLKKDIFDSVQWHLPIKVHVREYYDKSNFALANLTTQTVSNAQLESRGMINVQAIQGSDTLSLKEDESVGLFFPDRKLNDETNLFQGIEHNDDVSWEQTTFRSPRTRNTSGWSVTYYPGGDTIRRSKWWYEVIDDATFKIEHREEYGKKSIDTTDMENEELLGELTLESTNLGWINCDRLMNTEGPREDIIVEFEGEFVPAVSLVFEDLNAILPYSYREDNTLIFSNIPVGMDVTFIGLYKSKEDEKILFASRKSRTRKHQREDLNFRKMSADAIKSWMNKL